MSKDTALDLAAMAIVLGFEGLPVAIATAMTPRVLARKLQA
jgi:hypothetical protein